MDDEFHTVVNKIRALAKTLPRNSGILCSIFTKLACINSSFFTEKRHNVTEWRKRLLTEKHDRYIQGTMWKIEFRFNNMD